MRKISLIPVLIFALSLFFRVLYLDVFPPSMIHDELNYVLNAKSLYHTGKNIPLTASALLSWGETNYDVVISELPSLIIAPWIGPNPLNQFNARIIYAIFGAFSVILVYLIASCLLNRQISYLAGFLMAVNPWSIHFNRNTLEVNFAIFFFLLGTYILLITKSWKILWALPAFTAGFFCYLGAKLLFFPLVLILIVYKYFTSKKERNFQLKPLLIFVSLAFFVLLAYTLTINFQPAGTRTDELLIFENRWVEDIVNTERRQAIPNPFLEVFVNKLTISLRRIVEVYLGAFSSVSLFVRGETISVYSIWDYGQFHYLDFPLIVLGLVILFSLNRSAFFLILTIIAISPSVSAIDLVEKTYAVRSFSMIPFLVILAATGLWYIRGVNRGKLLFLITVGLYVVNVLYFAQLYFFRYPVYSSERWFLSERIISNYVKHAELNPDIGKVYVVTRESPKIVFEQYLFYGGVYEKGEDIKKANGNLENQNFSLGKVSYLYDCPEFELAKDQVLISDVRAKCSSEERGKSGIVSLADAGTVYILDNDLICRDFNLPRYYRPMNTDVFKIEVMDRQTFCINWIVKF